MEPEKLRSCTGVLHIDKLCCVLLDSLCFNIYTFSMCYHVAIISSYTTYFYIRVVYLFCVSTFVSNNVYNQTLSVCLCDINLKLACDTLCM